MTDTGRPKLTIRLDEAELRQFQAIAHNQGLRGAELGRQIILDYIAAQQEETPQP